MSETAHPLKFRPTLRTPTNFFLYSIEGSVQSTLPQFQTVFRTTSGESICANAKCGRPPQGLRAVDFVIRIALPVGKKAKAQRVAPTQATIYLRTTYTPTHLQVTPRVGHQFRIRYVVRMWPISTKQRPKLVSRTCQHPLRHEQGQFDVLNIIVEVGRMLKG
ncbi:uncharacterized protein BDR25DRAFT_393611 [Lindgomyces ingoldianus]|uniref:Uncharacterized protein n=1 Tax=Lindgomyces ingoldianus TaxID=673940 RepID=A0ACB6QVQ5_9PLEO|nr:uncharacterized protein BDR25DRAFT_393611 [Lindgomyces ingoldianus]KAF2471016.1 hypothetical protein BDR25DRAFT_393611 [Lindgomyces ingoldianus]